ncbi:MAG: hypothetical protein KJ955_07430 [Nanoarchaeota archaeon]|nr:hypothetical protein [Nanoarchaeota archaeon]
MSCGYIAPVVKRGFRQQSQKFGKSLYSQLDYIFIALIASLVFYREIVPHRHYLEEHARNFPWHKVVEIILATKNPRKKRGKFEIELNGYYVLFEVKMGIIYVINAKRG